MSSIDIQARLEAWTHRYPMRVGTVPLTVLTLRVVRSFLDVRVMGLAAEMTYYALLSVFPLIAALGASLGFLERIVGSAGVQQVEAAMIGWLSLFFRTDVTEEVFAPMVAGLLYQERTGFAVGGFLISLFLASRVFRAAIHTLDQAYRVPEARGTVALWTLGFLFSLGAIVTATVMLSMVVVGPLLGGGRVIAEWLGLGFAFEVAWALARWPVTFAIATAFLALLYHAGPNVETRWRHCIPAAIVGVVLLILVSAGFRVYLEFAGLDSPEIAAADQAVAIGAQVFGAVLAGLLWLWLSAVAILTGGVVNAELTRLRREPIVLKEG